MRWKLLLIASILAALTGAGLSLSALALLHYYGSPESSASSSLARLSALIPPVPAIIFAGIFVYRHTAKRRSLQATTTCFFTALLTLAILIIGLRFIVRF